MRLEKYIIADDVELTDESERWSLSHRLDASTAEEPNACYRCARFDLEDGTDFLQDDPAAGREPLMSPDEVLHHRIHAGLPAWGAELVPGLLPPEAGLDATAISYDKGCYLGQEVISRMKKAGKTNRHLVSLEVTAGLATPCDLMHDGQLAGTVTSVSPLPSDGRAIALGFRKRKFAEVESFSAGGAPARVLAR